MSLETLLEAAEFLEWSKTGKKSSSRETRTSRRAEKYQPYVLSERKKKLNTTRTSRLSGSSDNADDSFISTGRAKNLESNTSNAEEASLKDIKKCLGTRETHNKLEKNRRAHLKECFEQLRQQLPGTDDRRTSNLATLRSALRFIDQLVLQQRELENEKRRMQRIRNTRQAHINSLKKELREGGIEYNLDDWIIKQDNTTNSTNTASECGDQKQEDHKTDIASVQEAATPASIKPLEDLQLVIKTIPPVKTKPVVGQPEGKIMDDNVTVEAPAQAIQMIQQAAMKASTQQRLQLHMAPSVAASVAMSSLPTLSSSSLASQSSAAAQVVAVAKLPHVNPQKIVFAPSKPSLSTLQLGQMFVPNQNVVVPQVQAVNASGSSNNAGPLTVNLQTGKVITPRPVISRTTEPTTQTIAPKQLVLITADQQKIKATIASSTQTVTSMNATNTVTVTTQPQQTVTTVKTPMNTVIPVTNLTNLQPVKPAIITGMLPTTGADGNVSYVPVTLTTKPINSNENVVGTQFLNGGLTFVLPSSTSSTSMQHMQVAPAASVVTQAIPIQTSSLSSTHKK